jgi:thermosome
MAEKNNQPIFVLSEDMLRNTGRAAQKNNIAAAKLVAETVRTTLGPKGMDKMLVDSMNGVTVTNDGVTILEEMQIEHPAARMVVEVAKTQEDEIGDGTTTAVVFAGELLKQAEKLLEKNIHPTVIAKGYRQASEKAQLVLNSIAEKITKKDEDLIKKIALTAMTGKGAESSKELLSNLVLKGVMKVFDGEISRSSIRIEKKVGESVEDSELINGIVIDKEKAHPSMPGSVVNAKIALLDTSLEVKDTEIDAKISITDPSQMQDFIDMEQKMVRKMVDKVIKSGANVVFCQKGVDDLAQHFLAKNKIYAARRVKQSDMEALSKATGANIVTNLDDLSKDDLGGAGKVEEIKFGSEEMTYVKECENPKTVTILVRGGTEHVIDEVKRALEDAIGDVAAALKNGRVVAGAGAVEIELAKEIRKYASTLSGKDQLAVQSFADALDIIPVTLAENAGLDPIDILADLKVAHDKDTKWAGINVFTGRIMNAWDEGVIEPLKIKTQAISSATEVAVMILRIDDVIAAGKKGGKEPEMPGY